MGTGPISRPAVIERLAVCRRGLLLFVAGAIPLAFLPGLTIDVYYIPKTSLLLVGTALAGLLKILELALGGSARGLRRVLVPALGLGLPLVVAWMASPYRAWEVWGTYRRLQGLAPSLAVIVFGVLLCDALRGKGGARALAWTLAASGGLVSAYALVQMLGFDPFSDLAPVDFVPSTVGYSNFVGGFLAVCLPTCIGLWGVGGRGTRLAQALTILTAAGLLGSFSQGGWAAAAAGVAVFVGVNFGAKRPRFRTGGVVVAGLIVALMVAPVVLSLSQERSGPLGGSTATRGLHWETAVDIFADHPWIGRGPSAYLLDGASHRSSLESMWLDRDLADDPHSVPLATLVNAGLLGAVGYLLALGWILKRALALHSGPLAAAALGSLTVYFAQSLVSIDVITLRVSFWVCLAGLLALADEQREAFSATIRLRLKASPRRSVVGGGLASIALVLCLFAGIAGFRLLMADHHARNGVLAVGHGRTDGAIAELNTAMSLSSMGHYRHLLGEQLTAVSVKEEGRRPELLVRVQESNKEIERIPDLQWITAHARQLEQWSTYDPALLDDAQREYMRAQRVDRNNVFVGVRIADLQLRGGDPQGALRTLHPYAGKARSAPDFIPDYPEIWGAIAIAELQTGDVAGAKRALTTGHEMNPNECHVLIARGMLGSAFPKPLSKEALDLSVSMLCEAPTALLAELNGPHRQKANLLHLP